MTFSIVARCPRTNQLGAAAVTALPAVGKLVTYVEAGVGAVATQASTNPYYGIDGLALLRAGRDPDPSSTSCSPGTPTSRCGRSASSTPAGRPSRGAGPRTSPGAGTWSATKSRSRGTG